MTRTRLLPAATAIAALVLGAATVLLALLVTGRLALLPEAPAERGTEFYVVAYHYGYAFYDAAFRERDAIEIRVGETVTLHVVPAQALPRETFFAYAERSLRLSLGGLAPGDPRIRAKIEEDLRLGNVEHIVGIATYPVYVTTNVAAVLHGRPFRENGPPTLEAAVRQHDPSIRSVTFRAKRMGKFDVLCVDSGMEGAGTCGWGHKWMIARGAFVVRP